MSRDTVEADAYFESLIARVDQAVAEDASGGSVGAKEESPMWWQLLNYHSAAGVCVHGCCHRCVLFGGHHLGLV